MKATTKCTFESFPKKLPFTRKTKKNSKKLIKKKKKKQKKDTFYF